MQVDLVRVTTRDGLRLDGALRVPQENTPKKLSLDAVLFLHGVGANFYTSGTLDGIAPRLLKLGLPILSVNTRGHDQVYSASAGFGRRLLGAGFEIVDECRHDVAAWVQFLVERGHERLLLLGHSLGAIKSVYSQVHEPLAPIAGVVAMSPPRLSHRAFLQSSQSETYFTSLSQAEKMQEEGRGNELFLAQYPFPLMITASSYLDKYGPGERYNIIRFANQLPVPSLFLYGSKEVTPGNGPFAGVPEALKSLTDCRESLDVAIVSGGDHFYTGAYDGLAEEIEMWLQGKFSRSKLAP
jgi:pimeloyl-ACP methyl ester carboxylesterase